ncbi:MAG: hypothetical protein JXB49_30025 [Bacteroidales bacterium]|nr:hypothetical protein [Bacteroidales bacterium]
MIGNILSNNPSGKKYLLYDFRYVGAQAPGDSTNYCLGRNAAFFFATEGEYHKIFIPYDGTIVKAGLDWYAVTAGSGENISVQLRKNYTSNTLIETIGDTNNAKYFNNDNVNLSVVAGDFVTFRLDCPEWATNPANVHLRWWFILEA